MVGDAVDVCLLQHSHSDETKHDHNVLWEAVGTRSRTVTEALLRVEFQRDGTIVLVRLALCTGHHGDGDSFDSMSRGLCPIESPAVANGMFVE